MLRVLGVLACLAFAVGSVLLSLLWAGETDAVGVACCVLSGVGCAGWLFLAAAVAVGVGDSESAG